MGIKINRLVIVETVLHILILSIFQSSWIFFTLRCSILVDWQGIRSLELFRPTQLYSYLTQPSKATETNEEIWLHLVKATHTSGKNNDNIQRKGCTHQEKMVKISGEIFCSWKMSEIHRKLVKTEHQRLTVLSVLCLKPQRSSKTRSLIKGQVQVRQWPRYRVWYRR